MFAPPPSQPNLPVIHANLSGRIVLVIGTNVGLGLEAAKHFARMKPAKLFCTTRNEEKCAQTVEAIQKDTAYENVVAWPLELSSFASVKAFADRFEREGGGQLDIVVLNAAIATHTYVLTEDGHESMVQVNHLSGALLALRLLPVLLATGNKNKTTSRLVIVTSGTHESVNFGPERIPKDAKLMQTLSSGEDGTKNMSLRYRETKLLNVLFARALQDHIPVNSPVIVTYVDPGFSDSSLRRTVDRGQFAEWMKIMRTTEEGSRQLIIAAVGPRDGGDVQQIRGAYVADNEVRDPSEWVRSGEGKEVQVKLWDETWDILTKVDTKVNNTAEVFSGSQ